MEQAATTLLYDDEDRVVEEAPTTLLYDDPGPEEILDFWTSSEWLEAARVQESSLRLLIQLQRSRPLPAVVSPHLMRAMRCANYLMLAREKRGRGIEAFENNTTWRHSWVADYELSAFPFPRIQAEGRTIEFSKRTAQFDSMCLQFLNDAVVAASSRCEVSGKETGEATEVGGLVDDLLRQCEAAEARHP